MYCPSCGGAVARALTYCNHCGARLTGTEDDKIQRRSEQDSESIAWAILGALAVGLGGTIGLMAVMKEVVHFNMAWITGFTILSFLLVITVEAVLIRQLLHQGRRGGLIETDSPPRQTTRELEGSPARMLSEPVPSITEQPTQVFEPVYRERKSSV
jgi:hypothetical protein